VLLEPLLEDRILTCVEADISAELLRFGERVFVLIVRQTRAGYTRVTIGG